MQELEAPSSDNSSEIDPQLEQEPPIDNGLIETPQQSNPFPIAGFWLRGLAFVIDGIVIAIPLIIWGFVFRDLAFSLGPWGRLVGYTLFCGYLGFFNSRFGGGQTLGKRLTKIVVIDSDGGYLPLSKSVLRALILALVPLMNRWDLPLLQNPILVMIATVIIFGGGLALIYGLIFNRKTNQGLHDLIVGSYVVKAPLRPGIIIPKTPLVHRYITFGLIGLAVLLSSAGFFLQNDEMAFGVLEPEEWEEIRELHTTLSASDEFFSVGVQRSNHQYTGSPNVLKDLNINVWVKKSCRRNPEYCNELLKQVARTAFEQYKGIDNLTGMRIAVFNRFDLGLANGQLAVRGEWTIDDWRKQLK
jgi:uncharacterized RDD family membrane protein YckC